MIYEKFAKPSKRKKVSDNTTVEEVVEEAEDDVVEE